MKPCARGPTYTRSPQLLSLGPCLCLWLPFTMSQPVSWRKAPPQSVPTADSSLCQHLHPSGHLCLLGPLHLCHPASCLPFLLPASLLSDTPCLHLFSFGGLSGSLQISPAVFILLAISDSQDLSSVSWFPLLLWCISLAVSISPCISISASQTPHLCPVSPSLCVSGSQSLHLSLCPWESLPLTPPSPQACILWPHPHLSLLPHLSVCPGPVGPPPAARPQFLS